MEGVFKYEKLNYFIIFKKTNLIKKENIIIIF